MSYITTFDAAFWTSFASFFVGTLLQYLFGHKILMLALKYPKTSAAVNAAIGIGAVIFWFSWSVKGTTTAIFVASIVGVVFYKQLAKFNEKCAERTFSALSEA